MVKNKFRIKTFKKDKFHSYLKIIFVYNLF